MNSGRSEAACYLTDWRKKAWTSGVLLVIKYAKKLAGHRVGILNYFDHPITTGMVEGINNKIKVLKRKAYGYRDMEYFLLRIYFIHEAKYTLTGRTLYYLLRAILSGKDSPVSHEKRFVYY